MSRIQSRCRIARLFASVLLMGAMCTEPASAASAPKTLVIVLDGLRPDYVREDIMPNLTAIAARGVVCTNHHSVFPTVTRVNASTFSTGCYPMRHGILGNSIYVPDVDKVKSFSTGNAKNLMTLDEITGGRVLEVPTLGEILDSAGLRIFVASSGSTGSAFLLNPHVKGHGIVNSGMILPQSARVHVDELLGPAPEEATPNVAGNHRIVDALLRIGIDEARADMMFLWITDPDHTAHGKGVGTPETLTALKHVDDEMGRLFDALKSRGIDGGINVFITSDHGFSTQQGKDGLSHLLVSNGLKESAASTDVIIADGAIFVANHDGAKIRAIVGLLQKTDWVGAIFTRATTRGDVAGSVPGTFSFDSIYWGHNRAGDILVDAAWNNGANGLGWKGTTMLQGVAGHGTASPYDIHNTLIAIGPAFKNGIVSDVPTGNADVAPTVLHILGVGTHPAMDGRVLDEILAGGPDPKSVTTTHAIEKTVASGNGWVYRAELHRSTAAGHTYLDYAATTRVRR